MPKYLQDILNRLTALLNGMTKRADKWTKPDETAEVVQGVITEITNVAKEMSDAKEAYALTQSKARSVQAAAIKKADEIEMAAIAYEKGDQVQLNLYGIEVKKERSKRSTPSTVLQAKVQDDTDGVGFIVSNNSDPVADQYEWHKGVGTDPSKTDVIPEMKLFKVTTKVSFVDDDVQQGVRYFYRVRAVNAAGEGPWSEPVSRVQ